MNQTFVDGSPQSLNTKKTEGFRRWGYSYRTIPNTINDNIVGDKGIYSTTSDLFKWDQALYSEEIISQALLKKAFTPLVLHDKYTIKYGLGFRIKNAEDGKVVYHNGRWNGYRTSFHRYLNDSSSIIILNHTSKSINSRIIKDIEKILFTET